jgi:hypothetical protein
MGETAQASPNDQIMTSVSHLSDDMLTEVRTGRRNVMVTIGYLGSSIALLNPASAAEALARYEEIDGSPPEDDCDVCVMGFDDALRTYHLSTI